LKHNSEYAFYIASIQNTTKPFPTKYQKSLNKKHTNFVTKEYNIDVLFLKHKTCMSICATVAYKEKIKTV